MAIASTISIFLPRLTRRNNPGRPAIDKIVLSMVIFFILSGHKDTTINTAQQIFHIYFNFADFKRTANLQYDYACFSALTESEDAAFG